MIESYLLSQKVIAKNQQELFYPNEICIGNNIMYYLYTRVHIYIYIYIYNIHITYDLYKFVFILVFLSLLLINRVRRYKDLIKSHKSIENDKPKVNRNKDVD
jgi:hypothetical protein